MKILLGILLIFVTTVSNAQHGKELIDKLKLGSLTIFFRHSITDGADPHGKVNPPNENLWNCETQRPLNDQGRIQAKIIGDRFREHGIPIGNVYSSPVCRCEETARLAFGKVKSVDWMVIRRDIIAQPTLEKEMLEVPSTGFFTKTPTGMNNIYVGHAQTLLQRRIGPLFPNLFLEEGEGIVFDPKNKQYLGRIHPSKW